MLFEVTIPNAKIYLSSTVVRIIWDGLMSSKVVRGKGGVYKPRGQTRERGVAQMTTPLNNSYLVKVSTLGSKLPKILSTWFVHGTLGISPP